MWCNLYFRKRCQVNMAITKLENKAKWKRWLAYMATLQKVYNWIRCLARTFIQITLIWIQNTRPNKLKRLPLYTLKTYQKNCILKQIELLTENSITFWRKVGHLRLLSCLNWIVNGSNHTQLPSSKMVRKLFKNKL